MSHQSRVKTQIRDLTLLDRALHTFGQGLLYASQDPLAGRVTAMDNSTSPCEAVILPLKDGVPQWREPLHKYRGNGYAPANYREIGLQRGDDGAYTFVGDLSYPRRADEHGPCLPEAWGYARGSQPYSLLLREYAVQCGLYLAEQQGYSVNRYADPNAHPNFWEKEAINLQRPSLGRLLEDTPRGSTVLLLTGGPLPPHLSIVFTANPDGTTSIAVDGGTDSTCYVHTRPFTEALGTILADTSTLELAHQMVEGELVHISR